jgi:hypothetical protein
MSSPTDRLLHRSAKMTEGKRGFRGNMKSEGDKNEKKKMN